MHNDMAPDILSTIGLERLHKSNPCNANIWVEDRLARIPSLRGSKLPWRRAAVTLHLTGRVNKLAAVR